MNSANHSPTARPPKATWHGAPLLDGGPFQAWLRDLMRTRQMTMQDVARAVRKDEAAVRRQLVQARVSELVIERFGIALCGDPRLAAELYPELGA